MCGPFGTKGHHTSNNVFICSRERPKPQTQNNSYSINSSMGVALLEQGRTVSLFYRILARHSRGEAVSRERREGGRGVERGVAVEIEGFITLARENILQSVAMMGFVFFVLHASSIELLRRTPGPMNASVFFLYQYQAI